MLGQNFLTKEIKLDLTFKSVGSNCPDNGGDECIKQPSKILFFRMHNVQSCEDFFIFLWWGLQLLLRSNWNGWRGEEDHSLVEEEMATQKNSFLLPVERWRGWKGGRAPLGVILEFCILRAWSACFEWVMYVGPPCFRRATCALAQGFF